MTSYEKDFVLAQNLVVCQQMLHCYEYVVLVDMHCLVMMLHWSCFVKLLDHD